MYKEAFIKLELHETSSVLESLNPEFSGQGFDPLEAIILAQDVPFYPGYRLLDIADHRSMPPKRRFVLYMKNRPVVLDFSATPIYALNKELPIKLSSKNICDYVRFFFGHVRGPMGKITIIEGVDDIPWKDDPPPAARKAIGKLITPVTLLPSKKGLYEISACMVFKDSLLKAKLHIDEQGSVNTVSEELLIEDLPILDDIFGQ